MEIIRRAEKRTANMVILMMKKTQFTKLVNVLVLTREIVKLVIRDGARSVRSAGGRKEPNDLKN